MCLDTNIYIIERIHESGLGGQWAHQKRHVRNLLKVLKAHMHSPQSIVIWQCLVFKQATSFLVCKLVVYSCYKPIPKRNIMLSCWNTSLLVS